MFEELKELNLYLNEKQEENLNNYIEFFTRYNSNVNLVSKNDINLLFEKHIYDSLAFNLFYEKYKIKSNIKLLDIGTGGGFPSVPLAFLYNDMNINALDSVNKKIDFIRMISEHYNLKNLNLKCERIENSNKNQKYDVVTSRAMAELRIILEYAIPFVKTGGYFIAYKSLKADEEIKNAQNALKILNSKVIDKIEYSLPIEESNKRVLIVIKKEKETPNLYPRNNGTIKKHPL